MKTVIWYFTGTGNTLAVARALAQELSRQHGDAGLVPIPSLMHQDTVITDADAVGIVFPVYFFTIPDIVQKFVRKLRFTGTPYIFGIATCGEQPGGALFDLKSRIEERGQSLGAGFVFVMPENFIGPVDLMGDAGHRQEKYVTAESRIPAVAACIRERKQAALEGNDSALLRIGRIITGAVATRLYKTPRRFHATERCNRCRTCERICPTRNIMVEKDSVCWGKNCTQCYACIHGCPQGAVEIGGRTAGKPRYRHPDITLADMEAQRGV